jgi:hypothetical protein
MKSSPLDSSVYASANKAFNELVVLNNVKVSICEVNAEILLEAGKFKQRIDELENEVAHSPEVSFNHSLKIKQRFIKGEEVIKEYPKFASKYASQILDGRWEEAESSILKSIKYSYFYTKNVLNERWLDLEQKIINNESFEDEEYFEKYVIKYVDLFASYKQRFYEIEEVLAEKLSTQKLFEYWKYHVPAGKLSETGHNKLIASALNHSDNYSKEYVRILHTQKSQFLSYLKSLDVNQHTTIKELIDHVSTTGI